MITDSLIYVTGADIVFVSGGSIRDSIDEGSITMGQLLTELPFSNLIVTSELSGSDILAALEHGISLYPEPAGQFIHVSGIRIEFDPELPPGQRITEITKADGAVFDYETIYTVATIEFLAIGGDGFDIFNENLIYFGSDIEALSAYLATNPYIGEEGEGRVRTILPTETTEEHSPNNTALVVINGIVLFVIAVFFAISTLKK